MHVQVYRMDPASVFGFSAEITADLDHTMPPFKTSTSLDVQHLEVSLRTKAQARTMVPTLITCEHWSNIACALSSADLLIVSLTSRSRQDGPFWHRSWMFRLWATAPAETFRSCTNTFTVGLWFTSTAALHLRSQYRRATVSGRHDPGCSDPSFPCLRSCTDGAVARCCRCLHRRMSW